MSYSLAARKWDRYYTIVLFLPWYPSCTLQAERVFRCVFPLSKGCWDNALSSSCKALVEICRLIPQIFESRPKTSKETSKTCGPPRCDDFLGQTPVYDIHIQSYLLVSSWFTLDYIAMGETSNKLTSTVESQ